MIKVSTSLLLEAPPGNPRITPTYVTYFCSNVRTMITDCFVGEQKEIGGNYERPA